MLQKIALLAIPGVAPFEFGVVCEVFGVDRREHGGPVFDFHILTAEPGEVPTNMGFSMNIDDDLSWAAEADLVVVPAHDTDDVDEAYLAVIRAAEARGAWLLSVCSGAFVLAKAGVLDGRNSTTHWMHTDRLQREFPGTAVDPDVLFVEDRRVISSAGTASGIDACLHLVRKELGAEAANVVARRMVVPPQRDGGQSQYIPRPVVECQSDSFAGLLDWMLEHLDDELAVDDLARRVHMSGRTFARRFRAETGTTPAAWLTRQRLIRAQQLLEASDLGLEQVAQQAGFGTASVMRHHFLRTMQTTPTSYRRTFSTVAASA